MSIDLSKLSPAPWVVEGADIDGNVMVGAPKTAPDGGSGPLVAQCSSQIADNQANAAFIALARNAEDVLMRRKWGVEPRGEVWAVTCNTLEHSAAFLSWLDNHFWPHPFTALVEADAWYAANIEKQQ